MKHWLGWSVAVLMSLATSRHATAKPSPIGAPAAGTYQIHVVDIGTGLATVIEGHDFVVVYDGGGNDDFSRGAKNRLSA